MPHHVTFRRAPCPFWLAELVFRSPPPSPMVSFRDLRERGASESPGGRDSEQYGGTRCRPVHQRVQGNVVPACAGVGSHDAVSPFQRGPQAYRWMRNMPAGRWPRGCVAVWQPTWKGGLRRLSRGDYFSIGWCEGCSAAIWRSEPIYFAQLDEPDISYPTLLRVRGEESLARGMHFLTSLLSAQVGHPTRRVNAFAYRSRE